MSFRLLSMRISSLILLLCLSVGLFSCDYDGETIFRVINASESSLIASFENQGEVFFVTIPPGETDTLISFLDLVPLRDLGESFLTNAGINVLEIQVAGGQDTLLLNPQLRKNWVYMANAENMFRKAGDDVFSFEVVPDDIQ